MCLVYYTRKDIREEQDVSVHSQPAKRMCHSRELYGLPLHGGRPGFAVCHAPRARERRREENSPWPFLQPAGCPMRHELASDALIFGKPSHMCGHNDTHEPFNWGGLPRFRTHHYTVWSRNSTNETFDWEASGLAAACLNEWVSIDASRHITHTHVFSLCRCPVFTHVPTVTAGPRHRRRVVPRRARRERRRERA